MTLICLQLKLSTLVCTTLPLWLIFTNFCLRMTAFVPSLKQKLFLKREQYQLPWIFLFWRAVWFYHLPLFSIIYSLFHELSICRFLLPLLLIASAFPLLIHVLEPVSFVESCFSAEKIHSEFMLQGSGQIQWIRIRFQLLYLFLQLMPGWRFITQFGIGLVIIFFN